MSLATADGANPTVVEDALSGLVEGTAARADVEQSSLPCAFKKSRTLQVQLTGKPKGKPKPPSERKRVPATNEATPVVPACGTRVVEGQSTKASLPRACKMTESTCTKPEDTPSEMLLQCIQKFFSQILFYFKRTVSHSISPKFSGKIPYVLSKPRIFFLGSKDRTVLF